MPLQMSSGGELEGGTLGAVRRVAREGEDSGGGEYGSEEKRWRQRLRLCGGRISDHSNPDFTPVCLQ